MALSVLIPVQNHFYKYTPNIPAHNRYCIILITTFKSIDHLKIKIAVSNHHK